ncbi:hypothetical protein HYDPIDRAFT_114509 [Hydnomerulius pinastri MD-312]|uniref:Uncharacterized protein n=1 Tax=Hydnomerulius pinastri MD-312 TaxID=994086 RepID=A0A0C9WDE3_9AGAM|nr:hypothetical protein HYDPIDRAFT_114509 [Hydnomerulius pinastri MD-312]
MTMLRIAVVLQLPDAGRPPNSQLVDASLGAHMIPHPSTSKSICSGVVAYRHQCNHGLHILGHHFPGL